MPVPSYLSIGVPRMDITGTRYRVCLPKNYDGPNLRLSMTSHRGVICALLARYKLTTVAAYL